MWYFSNPPFLLPISHASACFFQFCDRSVVFCVAWCWSYDRTSRFFHRLTQSIAFLFLSCFLLISNIHDLEHLIVPLRAMFSMIVVLFASYWIKKQVFRKNSPKTSGFLKFVKDKWDSWITWILFVQFWKLKLYHYDASLKCNRSWHFKQRREMY